MANFINFEKFDGTANMAIDEAILADSIKNNLEPTLRLYGWKKPTLSLGRNQLVKNINLDYCRENNIDIVRRPTGGRAVFHHQELTYSFVVPANFLKNGNSVLSSYREISEALVIGLKKTGINLAFPEYKKVSVKDGYCMAISTGSDLNYQDKKLIGSAQFRSHEYILQHGSILIDIDNSYLAGIFGESCIEQGYTSIKEINPDLTDPVILSNYIKTGFEERFAIEFKPISHYTDLVSIHE